MALMTFEQWLAQSPYRRMSRGEDGETWVKSRGEDSTPIHVSPQDVRNAYSAYAGPLKQEMFPELAEGKAYLSNTSPYAAQNAISGQSQYMASGLGDASFDPLLGGTDAASFVDVLQGAPQSLVDEYLNSIRSTDIGQLYGAQEAQALQPYMPQKSGLSALFDNPLVPLLLAGGGLAGVTAPATGLFGAGATGAPTGTVGATGSTIGGTEAFTGLGGAGGSGLAGGAAPYAAGGATAAGAAGAGGAGAGGATTAGGAAAGAGTLAQFIKDYGPILGPIISGGLGILGSNAQADAYGDVANQFLNLGAPGRSAFDASFAPGTSPYSVDPMLQTAIDTASQSAARAAGARYGDPTIPGAQADISQYLLGNTILPQINTARSQFLTRGGLGVNTAGTGSLAQAQQAGGPYNAVGYAAGQILNPPTPLDQLMQQLKGYGIRIA